MNAKRLIVLQWKCAHLVDGDHSFPNMQVKEKSTFNYNNLLYNLLSYTVRNLSGLRWMNRWRQFPSFRD